MVGAEAGGRNNRGAIASDMKIIRNHLSAADGFIEEADTEDLKKQAISFIINAEGDLGKAGDKLSNGFLLNGCSLLTLFLWLPDLLPNRGLNVRREVGRCEIPKPVNEIVEGTDTGDIPGLESTEDGKEL